MTAPTATPIFILSLPRSGSTLLRCIIDTHPDICSPPELGLGALCDRLFHSAYYSVGQLADTEEERKQRAVTETRTTVRSIMDRYMLGKGKRLWCEKTTENIAYLPVLENVFPNAKYICLYRNCLDVVHSSIRFNPFGYMPELSSYVSRKSNNFIAAIMESWLDRNIKMLDFEEKNNTRCFRVTYESLVAKPGEILPKLFDFIGVGWSDSLLDEIFKIRHDQGMGDFKVWLSKEISTESVGKGNSLPRRFFPNDLVEKINILHESIGYSTLNSSGPVINHSENLPEDADNKVTINKNRITVQGVYDMLSGMQGDCSAMQGILNFVIYDMAGGEWTLDFSQSTPRIEAGRANNVDCTVTVSCASLSGIINGESTIIETYEQGGLTAEGRFGLALQFGKLLLGEDKQI
ncbi:sulfotransferase [Candidatus Methylospira mobilis]|uniref:sulfotransferase n=1 Tax=Candidatus Methylospira mobilis TaxID=1808979 RepID=UPI0028E3BF08|nr:sulfotransferase [Candidatus Methylospira mobilis]WNV05994.1 sulfotransferase [Candidatus Methylospira mobilis]